MFIEFLNVLLVELKDILGDLDWVQEIYKKIEYFYISYDCYGMVMIDYVYIFFVEEGLIVMDMNCLELKCLFIFIMEEEFFQQFF